MSTWPVRWQLTLWNTLVLVTLFLVFGGALLTGIHLHMQSQIDQLMEEEVHQLVDLLRFFDANHVVVGHLSAADEFHVALKFRVVDADANVVYSGPLLQNIDLPKPKLDPADGEWRFETLERPSAGQLRLLSHAAKDIRGETVLLQVVSNRELVWNETRCYMRWSLMALPAIILVSIGTGYLLARNALRPLQQMADVAMGISAKNLDQRLEDRQTQDEFGGLAATLNEMFGRLNLSMSQMQRFTSDAAHELRSPLASLRTRVEVALRSERSGTEYRRVLDQTLGEISRFSSLVDRLLLLSRNDAGQPSAQFDELRVDMVLYDVLERIRPQIEAKYLTLKVSEIHPFLISGDDIRVSEAFWNLLDNAVKYSPEGRQISISTSASEVEWSVSFVDQGIGIEPRHIPHLFDRFYRINQTSATYSGTGLGLAICESIVSVHRGRIAVASEPGIGSTFTVTFPGEPTLDKFTGQSSFIQPGRDSLPRTQSAESRPRDSADKQS